MAVNPNIQLTTTSAISSMKAQAYYDRKLLTETQEKLVWARYGQKRVMPRRNGSTIQFRRYSQLAAATTPLAEGVVPDGQALAQTAVTATVAAYAGYITISDQLDLQALDPVINDSIRLLGNQASLTLDTLTRDVMTAGTNVLYATGTSRAGIAATNVLTSTLVRKAVRTLKKNKAVPFYRNGKPYFYAIVGPETTYDLQSDEQWQKISQYQQAEKIEAGEIGKLFGVVFIETTNPKIFAGAGAGANNDVAATVIFGADAYGIVNIAGAGAIQSYVKPAGSAGTADPVNQISTIGWKVPAFAAKILNDDWIVRVEHGISA